MSRQTLFDRLVDLEISGAAGEDARGNETRSSTTIVGVPAHRSQVGAEEDTADRDQQARTFVYLLPVVYVDGDDVEHDVGDLLSGRDRIIDGDDTLEVLGSPVVATSRGRRLHVKARAYLEEG